MKLKKRAKVRLKKKIWVVKSCFALALLVMNFMMWYYLFESNKECGEQLWNFGCVTFVLFLFQFCQVGKRGVNEVAPNSRRRRRSLFGILNAQGDS